MPEGVTSGPAPAGLCIGLIGGRTVPIPAWIDLLKDAAIAAAGTPVAIVLPDTALAAEATALLCARDMAARYARAPTEVLAGLPTGHRVRVLPDEGVYEFCGPGDGGYWLQLLDVRNVRTDGRLWLPPRDAKRLEPTRRKRPLGRADRQHWSPLTPTIWDHFASSALNGNAALTRLSVVLIGARNDFEAALDTLGFGGTRGEPGMGVSDGLPWGRVDEDGEVELLHPAGAAGEPLIAVARDHISARRLAARYPQGSLLFISTRADDALNDRTSVEHLADRHACLVLAPGRLREGFARRREHGWSVTDLGGSDILDAEPTGVRALDRIPAASAWMRRSHSTLSQPSSDLAEAFRLLDLFGRHAGEHIEEDDDVDETARLLRQAFFEASDWLAAPDAEDLDELTGAHREIHSLAPRVKSVAGEKAADAAMSMMAALERFAGAASDKAMTPKGECVLRLADKAQAGPTFRQVIVTGHRRTSSDVSAFLDAVGAPMRCVTPTELAGIPDVQRINVLSVMRRDAFMRLVDPWAAPDVMFLGYQHEVDIYLQRLAGRQRLIDRLRPDEAMVWRIPGLAGLKMAAGEQQNAPEPPVNEPTAPLPRRRPQPASTGELTKPARYCRFAGRSWMAITDDHTIARLQLNREQKTQVVTAPARDLLVGDLILVREGGEQDIVREMAEQLAGPADYARLRHDSSFWRRRLRASGKSPAQLRDLLAEEGLDRGLQTLRYWMADVGPIGPHEPEASLPLIAAALCENPESAEWKSCLSAIHEVRKHHVTAGFRLTEVLMKECGETILEHSENETPFELAMGTVWLLEIEQVNSEQRPWPSSQVNRIHWESDSWRRRLLRAAMPKDYRDASALLKELMPGLTSEEER